MRIIKLLIGIFMLLIVSIAIGSYVFLKNFDLNKYKTLIEQIVYEQTGRKLIVKGEASLGISLIPTLIINDISFSNPTWAINPQMAEIGSLELKFSLLPLLKKQIIIDRAIVNNAQIYLETTSSGKNNWIFEQIKKTEPTVKKTGLINGLLIKTAHAEEVKTSTPKILDILTDIAAHEVSINNSRVYYISEQEEKISLQINNLTLSTEGINAPINIDWDIILNDINIVGQGTTGSLSGIFSISSPWPMNVDVEALNIKTSITANVYDILNKPRAEFSINLYNPAGNFNAPETTLIGSGNVDLEKISLNISSLDIVNNVVSGSLAADISGKVPYIAADLYSKYINLEIFNPAKPTAFILPEIVSSAQASELIPDEKIPYDLLQKINGNFHFNIDKLVINDDFSFNDVQLTAFLDQGVLKITPLQMRFGKGLVNVNAVVKASNQSLTLKIDTQDLLLQQLHQEFQIKGKNDFGVIQGGKTQVYADIQGQGSTYRSLINSLSGQILAAVEDTEIQSGTLSFLSGSIIKQVLDLLKIDTTKSKKVDLKCAVVRGDINNGHINFPKGIALDSDRLSIVSGGTINMHNDEIKLSLNAYGSGATDINIMQTLSSLIEIKGTLQNPKVVLDKSGALKTIAGLAAGPAYAGADMFFDRDPAPCNTALKGTIWQDHFPAASMVRGAAYDTYKGASDVVTNSVDAAGDAAKAISNTARQLIKNLLK